MNDAFIDTLTNDLEGTAYWRREKATEYPQDRRNDTAADTLDHLAEAIRADPRAAGIANLRKLDDELALRIRTDKNFDLSGLTVQCGDYRRRIGFSEFPTTAEQYLTTLGAMYRARLSRAREEESVLSAGEIRQLRVTAADLRSKVSQGSYGDPELRLFWRLTQSAGLTLKISNPELGMRAGLGDDFFMSVSREGRRPKLVNFLKALTAIVEVADERLGAIERVGSVRNPLSPRESRRDYRTNANSDDLALLWQIFAIDGRDWIPESRFQ